MSNGQNPASSITGTGMETLNIPQNHNFYKFLIVEELFFSRYLDNFHQGKCSTIGTVVHEEDGYYLENIRIKALSKKYWLPDGCLKIRLLIQSYGRIQEGKTAEVSGQAVLFDLASTEFLPYTTSAAITAHLQEIARVVEDTAEVISAERAKLKERYEPALLVHRLKLVDRARDLIERNLQMRMLQIYDKYEY